MRYLSILLTAIWLVAGGTAFAATPIVGADDIAAAQARGALLWDVRADRDYQQGHIPGAVNLDDVLVRLRDPRTDDYLPQPRIERILGEAGIDPKREIVLYGAKASTSPYFALIMLQWLGSDRASVFHGGIDDWKLAGKPLQTEPTRLPPMSLQLRARSERVVSTGDMLKRLNNPGVQIVDARTAKEFAGEDIRALRGGHIPGAINIPYESNWVDPETPRKLQRNQTTSKAGFDLKSDEELRALYAGLDPDKETVVYCQSGQRASQTAAVLQKLGFSNVKVYDASWQGYGNQLDAPAESVSYFNVARVNNLLNVLQTRVEELESQVAELKGGKKPVTQ